MYVDAHHLPVLFGIRDDVIDRDFRRRTGSGRHRDDRNGFVLRRRRTFQTSYIGKFRIFNDDSYCFCSIHGRTAADGNDAVSAHFLKCFHAVLYVFNCRIGFDFGKNFIGNSGLVQQVGYLFCHAEFDQIRIGGQKNLLKSSAFDFFGNVLNGTCAVI